MSFWADPYQFIIQWFLGVLAGWGLAPGWVNFVAYLIGSLILVIVSLLLTVFLIVFERKVIGRVQDRFGPNRVGPWGIFQTVADMIKIFTKEYITPSGVDKIPYNLAPILMMGGVLMLWAVIPFSVTFFGTDLSVAVLYIVAVGGIGELGVILAGWSSNNKFALVSAFRAMAQLISFEVPMVLAMLIPVMLSGSLSLNDIVKGQDVWYLFLSPVAAFIFYVTLIAEVGRGPFDLLEADSEIVAGFNTEYSGLKFGFFFVADFLHGFTIGMLFTIFFLGGWRGPAAEAVPILGIFYFLFKSFVVYFSMVMMRATLPRFRIDMMMNFNWKFLAPLALLAIIFTALLGKLIPSGMFYVQIPVMILMNILLWVGYSFFFSKFSQKHPRPVVAPVPSPIAGYSTIQVKPEKGA